jgi:hypothetical protein
MVPKIFLDIHVDLLGSGRTTGLFAGIIRESEAAGKRRLRAGTVSGPVQST